MSYEVKDPELKAYCRSLGPKEYRRQYLELYRQTYNNKRYSGLRYTNDTAKLKAIKDRYKNGISDNTIKEMVGIEC